MPGGRPNKPRKSPNEEQDYEVSLDCWVTNWPMRCKTSLWPWPSQVEHFLAVAFSFPPLPKCKGTRTTEAKKILEIYIPRGAR
jgi:DnaJ family protein A protein 2